MGTVALELLPKKLNSLGIGESLLDFSKGGTAQLILGNQVVLQEWFGRDSGWYGGGCREIES